MAKQTFYQMFPQYAANKPIPTPAPQGRKGFSKFLPAALAIGGTLAAAPFTGGASLLGTAALLGGGAALGGAAGEGFAQRLNNEQTDVGKIGKEALISGATGAIPIGGAAKAARVSQIAKEATPEVAQVGRGSLLSRVKDSVGLHGQQMEARSGGYAVNAKQPGMKELDIAGSKNVDNTIRKEGIGAGSPLSRLSKVEDRIKSYGSQIDTIVGKNNIALSEEQRQQIANKYLKSLQTKMGTNETVMSHAQTLADNFVKNGGKDAKGLITNKRQLDADLINYIKNPDSALAHEQRAVVPFRQALKDEANNLVPGLKEANNKYHDLSTAKGYLVKGTGEMNGRGGIVQRVAESGPIKTAESYAGAALQKVAGASPPPINPGAAVAGTAIPQAIEQVGQKSLLSRVTREGIKQGVGQTVGNALLSTPQPVDNSGTDQPSVDNTVPTSDTTGISTDVSGGSDLDSKLQEAMNAAEQALASGDSKGLANIKDYISILQSMQPKESSNKFNSTAAGNISDFDSSISELDKLSQSISNGGGSTSPILGRVRSINPFDTSQQTLQAEIDKTRQIVGKALEGGVLRKEDEAKYKKILPTTSDTREVALAKIAMVKAQIQAKLQDYSGLVGGGTSLEDLLGPSTQGSY